MWLLAVLAIGCVKESINDHLSNQAGSTLKLVGEYKISAFTLPGNQLTLPGGNDSFVFHLTSRSNGDKIAYDGRITTNNTQDYLCEIMIPKQDLIPDGDYTLMMSSGDRDYLNRRLWITVRSEMVSRVLESEFVYTIFAQQGTAEDPYQVTNDLFSGFLELLLQDPGQGEGFYFVQTEDISIGKQNKNSGDAPFAKCCFAGNYNGQGHTLTFTHSGTGTSRDNGLGVFRELKDNAFLRNLVLQVDLEHVGDTVGTIAAFSSGDVVLDNITLRGSISGAGNYIGGLIGKVNNGTVTIRSVTPELTISGAGNEVGGLIGRVENAILNLTDIDNDNVPIQSIEGKEAVGGAVGYLKGSFALSRISFTHASDPQGQTPIVIRGDKYTGGVIGRAEIDAGCSLSEVSVVMPIHGGDYTGGVVGELLGADASGIDFCSVNVSGRVVSGTDYVGGFIGSATVDVIHFNKRNFIPNIAEAQIEGTNQVGGIFGSCRTKNLENSGSLSIQGNVTGSGNDIGGFAGYVCCDAPILLNNNFTFSSELVVSGCENVGGFAGRSEHTEYRGGETSFTPDPINVVEANYSNVIFSGTVNSTADTGNAGCIVGYGSGVTLDRLYVTGRVYGGKNVGGIAGRLDESSVISCGARCVSLNAVSCIGGIVGYLSNAQRAEKLFNYSEIEGDIYVGGIAGYVEGPVTISKSANMGNRISGGMNVGGIVGYGDRDRQVITDCGNFGEVLSQINPTAESGIGGIIGKNASLCTIQGCVNRGTIKVTGGDNTIRIGVGGIAGYLGEGGVQDDSILVERCCNFATIETTAETKPRNRQGGIVGYMRGGSMTVDNTVTNCYNRGGIKGQSKDNNGGIVGTSNNCTAATYSFNAGKVEYGNGGIGHRDNVTDIINSKGLYMESGSGKRWKSIEFASSQRSQKDSFPLLDFDKFWDVDGITNDGYPFLRDCYYQFATVIK